MCEESGTDLAQEVLKQVRKRARDTAKAVVSDSDKGTAQAVGKIVGSLCVVSAKRGDAESAMLASWVSQASFRPPGLTVAVKKERAIESLVQPGGKFVLNVLAENSEKARACREAHLLHADQSAQAACNADAVSCTASAAPQNRPSFPPPSPPAHLASFPLPPNPNSLLNASRRPYIRRSGRSLPPARAATATSRRRCAVDSGKGRVSGGAAQRGGEDLSWLVERVEIAVA